MLPLPLTSLATYSARDLGPSRLRTPRRRTCAPCTTHGPVPARPFAPPRPRPSDGRTALNYRKLSSYGYPSFRLPVRAPAGPKFAFSTAGTHARAQRLQSSLDTVHRRGLGAGTQIRAPQQAARSCFNGRAENGSETSRTMSGRDDMMDRALGRCTPAYVSGTIGKPGLGGR